MRILFYLFTLTESLFGLQSYEKNRKNYVKSLNEMVEKEAR